MGKVDDWRWVLLCKISCTSDVYARIEEFSAKKVIQSTKLSSRCSVVRYPRVYIFWGNLVSRMKIVHGIPSLSLAQFTGSSSDDPTNHRAELLYMRIRRVCTPLFI